MPVSVWTRVRLDALAIAIQRGVLSISADGETSTYASPKELRDAYDYCEKKVLEAEGTPRARPSGLIRIRQSGTGL